MKVWGSSSFSNRWFANHKPMTIEPRQGPKDVVSGRHGMVSSSHPEVSRIMVDVMKAGGNAVDAADPRRLGVVLGY